MAKQTNPGLLKEDEKEAFAANYPDAKALLILLRKTLHYDAEKEALLKVMQCGNELYDELRGEKDAEALAIEKAAQLKANQKVQADAIQKHNEQVQKQNELNQKQQAESVAEVRDLNAAALDADAQAKVDQKASEKAQELVNKPYVPQDQELYDEALKEYMSCTESIIRKSFKRIDKLSADERVALGVAILDRNIDINK